MWCIVMVLKDIAYALIAGGKGDENSDKAQAGLSNCGTCMSVQSLWKMPPHAISDASKLASQLRPDWLKLPVLKSNVLPQ